MYRVKRYCLRLMRPNFKKGGGGIVEVTKNRNGMIINTADGMAEANKINIYGNRK